MSAEVPDIFKEAIARAHFARGSIMNSYAQVEYLLADLAAKCRDIPEYQAALSRLPYRAESRVAKIKAICELGGPLSPYADVLAGIAAKLLEFEDDRHFFAHGFCQLHYTKEGRVAFHFRRFEPEKGNEWKVTTKYLTPIELEELKTTAGAYQELTLSTFERIYRELHLEYPWPKQQRV